MEPRLLLAVFTVTSVDDSGPGTLRQAILDANAAAGADTIAFNIASADPVKTIALAGPLPQVSDPVVIDGASQPGYAGSPLIELNGLSAGAGTTGLTITAGSSTVRGLIINRFKFDGIELTGGGGNAIQACWIGTGNLGSAASANGGVGVYVNNSADNVIGGPSFTVGGVTHAGRNVISGNASDGVFVEGAGSTGNIIRGNYVGVSATGAARLANRGNGITLGSGGNAVGGPAVADRNVISGNNFSGLLITGPLATGNAVEGNYVGTNAAGTAALGNQMFGVNIDGAAGNTIGGAAAAGQRNVISGNVLSGIAIENTFDGNTVQGNLIGLDAAGSAALANGDHGVVINRSAGNLIGGPVAGARNVISGNAQNGVTIQDSGSTGNRVQGNYVGLNLAGTAAVGNADDGVDINNASANIVGGLVPEARNVISGNGSDGVEIQARLPFADDATGNLVQGNYIGTNAAGTSALGNASNGVRLNHLDGAGAVTGNTIGGAEPGAGNVIAGNLANGVQFSGATVTGNVVRGNLIGTGVAGAALSNGGNGVGITDASGALVELNTIAFNDAGIVVSRSPLAVADPVGNRFSRNSIHSNVGLGIDLSTAAAPMGVTPNDPLDPDEGPNRLQNFPVLTSVTPSAASTSVAGTIDGPAGAELTIEFFASDAADGSGHGEGRTYLGSANATLGAGGVASFDVTLPVTLPPGNVVTATATGAGGDTSEFSAARGIDGSDLVLTGDAGLGADDVFRLVRNAADPALLDVFVNTPGPAPTRSIPFASLHRVIVQGLARDDVLTLDFAHGEVTPPGGITWDGGANGAGAGDALHLRGASAADAFTLGPALLRHGDREVSITANEGASVGPGQFAVTSDLGGLALQVETGGTVTFAATQHLASLTLLSGASAGLDADADLAIVTGALALAGSPGAWQAKLDLAGGALVLRAGGGGDLGTLVDQVRFARNGGAWDREGITSSAAASDPEKATSLAAVSNDAGGGAMRVTSLAGQALLPTDLLVLRTFDGDANLDRRVDAADYFLVDSGRALARAGGWTDGDFDYSGGPADADDYVLIDAAFLAQRTPPTAEAEPSASDAAAAVLEPPVHPAGLFSRRALHDEEEDALVPTGLDPLG